MTSHLYKFRGTEADSELPPITPQDGSLWPYEPSLAPLKTMHDDIEGVPTTRRFARTMYSDSAAFPDAPEYASPITRADRALTWFDRLWPLWFALAAGLGGLAAVAKLKGWF